MRSLILSLLALVVLASVAEAQCGAPRVSAFNLRRSRATCSTGTCNLEAQQVAPLELSLPAASASAATSASASTGAPAFVIAPAPSASATVAVPAPPVTLAEVLPAAPATSAAASSVASPSVQAAVVVPRARVFGRRSRSFSFTRSASGPRGNRSVSVSGSRG